MNLNIIILMQVVCIVLGSGVKRDGVYYQPSLSDILSFGGFPIMISKVADSSESISLDAPEVPVEFPFDIAKSLDEFYISEEVSETKEETISNNTAIYPITDTILNTEKGTENITEIELSAEKNPSHEEELKDLNAENSDQSVSIETMLEHLNTSSEASVSEKSEPSISESGEQTILSIPEIMENRRILREIFGHNGNTEEEKEPEDNFTLGKRVSDNEISKESKERSKFFDESIILKKVNGKPVEGTMIVKKGNSNEVEKAVIIGKENGTAKEKTNLEKIDENLTPFQSYMLRILGNPYGFRFG